LQAFPEAEENLEQLEDYFEALAEQGIAVYDDDAAAQATPEGGDDGALAPSVPLGHRQDLPSDIPASDLIGLYFSEAARVPLLTREEEQALAHQWQQGREAARCLSEDNHNETERARLRRDIRAGNAARDHLITANTRLVISIAKRYQGQGVPFIDMIQEGNLGLMRAVDRFDPDRGYKFSTYATWWIRQAVSRAVANQGRTIRLPVHMSDTVKKLYRTITQMEQEQGRRPTLREISEETGLRPRRVRWIMRVAQHPLSLQKPIGEEEDSELGSLIEDEEAPMPAEAAEQALLRDTLEELLSTLNPREARILRMRFGLDNGHEHTLEEIGDRFGVTRERIRQIEQRALQRLRHPRRRRWLRGYLA
jgi:RNA polymerase primary sigma factor